MARCAIGNAAAMQDQHDTYGSVILAAMPMFFDQRLPRPGDEALFRLLEPLGEQGRAIWRSSRMPASGNIRGRTRVHTHSAAMCWAGCQPARRDRSRLGLPDRAAYWNAEADKLHRRSAGAGLESEAQGVHRGTRHRRLDASVLLLPELGLIEPSDPRFVSTVEAVERDLLREKHVMRYAQFRRFRHCRKRRS